MVTTMMKFNRKNIFPIATIFFSLLMMFAFLSGCAKKDEDNSSAQSESSSSGDFVGNVSKVSSVRKAEGTKVADFTWTDENGKKTSFAEFSKDNVVLINFWATWCGPCKRELPDLVAIRNEYKDQNIKILGISVDQDGDVLNLVHNFAQQANLAYPIIIDNGDLQEVFGGIRGIPTSFFINKKGEIVKKMIGLQTKDTFKAELLAAAK